MAQPDPESITLFRDMPEALRALAVSAVDGAACRRLWASVILSQWALVFEPKRSDRPHERDAAARWFGSRDFFAACALAGIDGQGALSGFRERLDRLGGKGAAVPPAADPARHDRARKRRLAIQAMLDAGSTPLAAELARTFGVSCSMVHEDLRVIRAGRVA